MSGKNFANKATMKAANAAAAVKAAELRASNITFPAHDEAAVKAAKRAVVSAKLKAAKAIKAVEAIKAAKAIEAVEAIKAAKTAEAAKEEEAGKSFDGFVNLPSKNATSDAAKATGKTFRDCVKHDEKVQASGKGSTRSSHKGVAHKGGNHKGGNSFVHEATEPLDAISSDSPTIAKHCLKRAPMPTMFESILWLNMTVTDSELDDSTPAVCKLFERDTLQSA